ncbi:MAG TPA: F0F1 ATP synthase subunit A [Verrucomicrobiae bacterium]|nr:F0F1 ATP synthase subunit A [Verrucomicrobiae bacterium]
MHEQIGEHTSWQWPIVGNVHADTLVMTWVVMILVLLFCWSVGRSYRSGKVTKRQTVFEGLINFLSDLSLGTLGRAGEPFVPFFVALFMYIFCLNQIGFVPLKLMGFAYGGAPTADLNTTAAYALLIFVMIQVVAIRKKGLGFYKHLAKPFALLLPLNIFEESLRPVVMAARLFFNIFVGEILLFVISQIIVSGAKIGWFDLSIGAAFTPILIQFLNFFVGSIQAFVFTLLAIVYLSMAVGEEH